MEEVEDGDVDERPHRQALARPHRRGPTCYRGFLDFGRPRPRIFAARFLCALWSCGVAQVQASTNAFDLLTTKLPIFRGFDVSVGDVAVAVTNPRVEQTARRSLFFTPGSSKSPENVSSLDSVRQHDVFAHVRRLEWLAASCDEEKLPRLTTSGKLCKHILQRGTEVNVPLGGFRFGQLQLAPINRYSNPGHILGRDPGSVVLPAVDLEPKQLADAHPRTRRKRDEDAVAYLYAAVANHGIQGIPG